jgi:hypothetical protein
LRAFLILILFSNQIKFKEIICFLQNLHAHILLVEVIAGDGAGDDAQLQPSPF